MERFTRAHRVCLRTLATLGLLAGPLALTPAAANHGSYNSPSYNARILIGTLTVDGRCFEFRHGYSTAAQIRNALCAMGYNAYINGCDVIVRTDGCRRPHVSWNGCDYDLCSSWRGTRLTLSLSPVNRYPSTGHSYGGYSSPKSSVQIIYSRPTSHYDSYRPSSWGCSSGVSTFHSSVRFPNQDRGWDRRWSDDCDRGFNVRVDARKRHR